MKGKFSKLTLSFIQFIFKTIYDKSFKLTLLSSWFVLLYFLPYFSFHCVEGLIGKVYPNKRSTERYVFLLDGLLICCKQVSGCILLTDFL